MCSDSEHGTSGKERSDFEADFDVEVDYSLEEESSVGAEAIIEQLQTTELCEEDEDDDSPYSLEPLADQEWLRHYRRQWLCPQA